VPDARSRLRLAEHLCPAIGLFPGTLQTMSAVSSSASGPLSPPPVKLALRIVQRVEQATASVLSATAARTFVAGMPLPIVRECIKPKNSIISSRCPIGAHAMSPGRR